MLTVTKSGEIFGNEALINEGNEFYSDIMTEISNKQINKIGDRIKLPSLKMRRI